jgi:hypothetical protein
MDKVIFLDIDGVISTYKQYSMNRTKFRKKYGWADELKVPYPFDKKCVDILNEIIDKTDCEIVLSSDWRRHWNLSDLDKIFKHNLVKRSPVDTTPIDPITFSNSDMNRFHEIIEFIKKHDLKNWVIIDDLKVGYYLDENTKERFFLTNDREGIKKSGLKNKIISKLNG